MFVSTQSVVFNFVTENWIYLQINYVREAVKRKLRLTYAMSGAHSQDMCDNALMWTYSRQWLEIVAQRVTSSLNTGLNGDNDRVTLSNYSKMVVAKDCF